MTSAQTVSTPPDSATTKPPIRAALEAEAERPAAGAGAVVHDQFVGGEPGQ
ncbi:MAG: hypothetical protein JF598_00770 [Streptomyces sp.]|nr:hypothetical protein [Streptomyces sp.]